MLLSKYRGPAALGVISGEDSGLMTGKEVGIPRGPYLFANLTDFADEGRRSLRLFVVGSDDFAYAVRYFRDQRIAHAERAVPIGHAVISPSLWEALELI